ncbi:NADH-quinone oxidoreductase subunit M, partial [Mycobacterium sp. 852013-50091_SCH5140682]|uniref:NADH-quinone oxidoreductase subunit M n=1 Tax=Mycobacterium sp. 852013-50091_SCH5140682 TaxID=1834109 RepID=UPI000B2F323A
MECPWLTILWLSPTAGAGIVMLLPRTHHAVAKWVGLVVALAVLGITGVVATGYEADAEQYQFLEKRSWIDSLGAGYTVGIDGIALVLVILTAALTPLLIIAGWNDASGRANAPHAYVALMLALESLALLSFVALDVVLFYVAFEATLLPLYFLIGGYGGNRTQASSAAVKFLLYNLFGGLVMLAAVVGLYVVTAHASHGTLDVRHLVNATHAVDPAIQRVLFLGFFAAFAVKAPLWPLHTWLPGVATSAKPATAVMMMAIVDKVGTFGMLRYCLPLFPDSATYFRPVIVTLAVIGIVYGAVLAIGQTDVMRLIA